jgi:hypothetical protein
MHGCQGYVDAADPHRRRPHAEETHGSAAGYGGGGGYVRRPTQPHKEETHGSVAAGYGGYGRKGHGDDNDEQSYRKPKPAYRDDDDHQAYRKPKPAAYGDDDDHQAYRKPKPAAYGDERPKYHGGRDERPSYGRKKQVSDDVGPIAWAGRLGLLLCLCWVSVGFVSRPFKLCSRF